MPAPGSVSILPVCLVLAPTYSLLNNMQRFSSVLYSSVLYPLFFLVGLGLVVAGCDESPTSVDDFDVQPNVNVSTTSLSLVLSGGDSAVEFSVDYQGLNSAPVAEGSGVLTVEKASESGSPTNGAQTWRVTTNESVSGIVEEAVTVRSPAGGREIRDTLSVRVSPFVVTSEFTNDFAVVADFEDAQRDSMASGGTMITPVEGRSNVSSNSNGVTALEVQASGSGAVTFERRASGVGADRFTFLVKPDPSTDFNLTLTFTDEDDGAEETHEITIPVNAGDQWLKYGIAFGQIGSTFDPVATRAGGNGPMVSVQMSADAAVTYAVDELMLANETSAVAEIEDFERTSLAYGPPFCPPDFENVSSPLSEASDGFTAQSIAGSGCFGYNYQFDGGPALFLNLQGSDVLSVRGNATAGDSLFVFVETADGNAGGFEFGSGYQVGLPVGTWGTVDIPLDSLGDDASALGSAGITNVGFEARGEDPDFIIDDIIIRRSGN